MEDEASGVTQGDWRCPSGVPGQAPGPPAREEAAQGAGSP